MHQRANSGHSLHFHLMCLKHQAAHYRGQRCLTDMGAAYQPRHFAITMASFYLSAIMRLSRSFAVDRYALSRHFNLELFERTILQCTDVAELQNMCIKLHASVHSQRVVYEALLRDGIPKIP